MSATNAFESAILEHILNNADVANVGDAAGLLGSAADGNLYLSLHTADPGETGTQTTSECAYTDYARVAVTRDGTAWTVTTGVASLDADTDFPKATGGTETVTHFGIGTASSGTGNLLLSGTVTPNISVSNGVTPRLEATTTTVTCD